MTRMTFERFLMDYFTDENPEVLDDDLPDAFSAWVADLSPDEWFSLGDKFAQLREFKERERIFKILKAKMYESE